MKQLILLLVVVMNPLTLSVAQTLPVRGEFNADGNVDLVMREDCCSGHNQIGYMQDSAFLGRLLVTNDIPDQNWKIVGAADFNADGKTDLLWRNILTGANAVWYLDGLTYSSGQSILAVPDTNWEIGGVADIDLDSHHHIVWRNRTTGQNAVWFMDGINYESGETFLSVPDPNWMITAAADFSGDGKPDLLWRNTVTGQNAMWFMDRTNYVSGHQILSTPVQQGWSVGGVGDFDDDGKTDIVWHAKTFGDGFGIGPVRIWFMDGATYLYGTERVHYTSAYFIVGVK